MVEIAMHMSAVSPSSLQIPNSSTMHRSTPIPIQSQLPSGLSASSLSLGPLPLPPPPSHHRSADRTTNAEPLSVVQSLPEPSAPTNNPGVVLPLPKVKLSEITPYDGAPTAAYNRAVDVLSTSLMKHNAAVIVLGCEESALLKCALESGKMYFRLRGQTGCNLSKNIYMYRAGRALEEVDSSPACLGEAFRCMGKASRAALCAIARNLRLRSDAFNHLLDDTPLPANEASSSVLVATYSCISSQNGKGIIGGKAVTNCEVEKGLLTLIASDNPGIQVCDPNGRWYLADGGLGPGDLLLLTGRALSHVTAGLRHAAMHRTMPEYVTTVRTSLLFKLMPQSNAVLDCSPVAAAGHVTPQSFVPISVSQFMDDLSTEEMTIGNCIENNYEVSTVNMQPSLRSALSDPLSGAFLEDAMAVSCGHSFGGMTLRKVIDMSRCTICGTEIDGAILIPNHALRAAAAAVKHDDGRRLFHNAAARKRRKETSEQVDAVKRLNKGDGDITPDGEHFVTRTAQYPFSVSENVIIKGNRRTPDKFVGRQAVITSQCLNGWYLLKTLDNGESVRLQYRSLQKISRGVQGPQPQLVIENGR